MGYFPVSSNDVMSDTPPPVSPDGLYNGEQPFVDTSDLRGAGSQGDLLEEQQPQPLSQKQTVRRRGEERGRRGGERKKGSRGGILILLYYN